MYKAVVVDDEELVREAVIALGRWRDFGIDRILEASNAREALELIRCERPDIVISDMKMPVMNGIELLKELAAGGFAAKVIVVSGYSDYEYTRQAIRSNVVDYILKPVDSQELNNAIAAAISEIEDEKCLSDTAEADPAHTDPDPVKRNAICDIERYVSENFCNEITLEELAHRFFICKEHISRSFKKQYGMNLFDYISMLRIEKAKVLMLETLCSIEEIAVKAGFSNGNYFSKAFRRQTGISPSEYRSGSCKR
jgi:YesN/AraC family two-component response regulator